MGDIANTKGLSRSMANFERMAMERRVAKSIERMRRDDERNVSGYVYFIRCEGYVKVGYSSNPSSRLRALAVMCPFPCHVIGKIPGGKKYEADIHVQLKDHHHRGEWFKWTEEVESIISRLLVPAI